MASCMRALAVLLVVAQPALAWGPGLEEAGTSQPDDGPLASFANPPRKYRPKFRYWLPDGSVPPAAVAADISALASVGAGGLEFVPFFNYGLPPAPTDWSTYGFGTTAYNAVFEAALAAAAEHEDLRFDFAAGASEGQGVPSTPQTPGLAVELVYGAATITTTTTTTSEGATFAGQVPEPNPAFNFLSYIGNEPQRWGENKLVAVVAARLVGEPRPLPADALGDFIPGLELAGAGAGSYYYVQGLDEASLTDLTDVTTAGGYLNWTAPCRSSCTSASGNGSDTDAETDTWVLFAMYERYTNQKSVVSVSNASSALDNGSWVVDHFSGAGAARVAAFLEERLLGAPHGDVEALLRRVGEYAWEDSMEFQAALLWTPGMLARFARLHGYSVVPYLPLLFHAANQLGRWAPPYNTTYILAGEDGALKYESQGGPHVQDYHLALGAGYAEYLGAQAVWARDRLGLQWSCQPAYNQPLDMTAAVPLVPIPELESLGFANSISAYRQFTGAAHLSVPRRNVISTEVGAVLGAAYKQRLPELAALFAGSFAGGVNMLVAHGYAYSGPYAGTTWPGYAPFALEFSDAWNARQPAWRHGHVADTLAWAARCQAVLQTGAPRVDVAWYYYESPWDAGAGAAYPVDDDGFNAAGFAFEYLGPANLANLSNPSSAVRDGRLAPNGPAYRALVLHNQTHISPGAAAALVDLAQAGLPVYIVGSAPNTTIGTRGQTAVGARVAELLALASNTTFKGTVRVIPNAADFSAATLLGDGIRPRARVLGVRALGAEAAAGVTTLNASSLYTAWRSDAATGTEYAYLFNTGLPAVFNLSFDVPATARPYRLDAWTGAQTPLVVYQPSSRPDSLSLEVILKSNQTALLGFVTGGTTNASSPLMYVTEHSPNVAAVTRNAAGQLEALVDWSDSSTAAALTLSNGSVVTFAEQPSPRNLTTIAIGPWNLTVASHGPPDDFNTTTTTTTTNATATVESKITAIDAGTLPALAPWTAIPGLERASGLGTYTATFALPALPHNVSTQNTVAAAHVLSFGPVLHTLRAWVNGRPVPTVDPTDAVVDVSDLVRPGENEVRVEVASTLFNVVKANIDAIRIGGQGVMNPTVYMDADWEGFGLVGPVELRVLERVVVA